MAVNQELREYVTRTGFDLRLSKTQIQALVWLDAMANHPANNRTDHREPHPITGSGKWFVVAGDALQRKGLAWHRHFRDVKPDARFIHEVPWNKIWGLTDAGRMVISLLMECGLYADYRREMLELAS